MITVPELAAEALGAYLDDHMTPQICFDGCEFDRTHSVSCAACS
jgi:hypothetical protein